jgi:hypothetical protein
MARPPSELTKLIQSLPSTLSVKEVIAEAKKKGFTTTESNVHRVRRLSPKKGKAAAAPAPAKKKAAAAPAKKRGSKPAAAASSGGNGAAAKSDGGKPTTKTAFVLSFPSSTSPRDIVAKAKEQGISLSRAYVYYVRSTSGGRGAKAAPSKPAASKPGRPAAAAPAKRGRPVGSRNAPAAARPAAAPARSAGGGSETAFREAAINVLLDRGLVFASNVLDEISSKLRAAAAR